jgi:hypothetical protein
VRFAKGDRKLDVMRPHLDAPPAPIALRQALRTIERHIEEYVSEARMAA